MNCQVVQNKILALPDPRVVPDPLREHVVGCAGCQAWAKQAARLEALLEQLPTPLAPADKKDALIGNLVRGDAIIARPATVPVQPREARVLTFLRRNAAVIGGLAAAILVALGAWALFPRPAKPEMAQPLPDDPFLRKIVQRDLALANAKTPAERLQILSGLADDLSVQARSLARVATRNELGDLARWYDQVVKNAIVPQAENAPAFVMVPAERTAREALLESLAKKLNENAAETDKLLSEVPPEAKAALQRMTESAREGQKKLQEEQKKLDMTDMRGKK